MLCGQLVDASRLSPLLGFLIVLKVGCIVWVANSLPDATISSRVYSYIGADYPQSWDVGDLQDILIPLEPTTHYQLDTSQSDVEWEALAPNDGVIYLGPNYRPFSISHFHQMRCLDVLRKQLVSHREKPNITDIDTPLSRHCYNYLREMVLCRSTTALDPVFGRPRPATVVEYRDDSTCRDWNRVYEGARRNVEDYSRWKAKESTH